MSGLSVRNDDGHLIISSEGTLLNYVGKAQYLSTVDTIGNPDDTKPGKSCGYMNYRISNPNGDGRFLIGFDLPVGYRVGILPDWTVQVAPGVFDVRIYCGSNYDYAAFDATQTPIDIWIFAMGVPGAAPTSNFGLCLYNSYGQLTVDFNKPNPLFIRDSFDMYGKTGQAVNINYVYRPILICLPNRVQGDQYNIDNGSGNPYGYTEYRTMVRRDGATTLLFETVKTRQYQWFEEPPDYDGVVDTSGIAFIVDGAGLP